MPTKCYVILSSLCQMIIENTLNYQEKNSAQKIKSYEECARNNILKFYNLAFQNIRIGVF